MSHDNKYISSEAKSFFRSHDIAHVLFGCDISLYGEGSVKLWTLFGTTLGFWDHINGYRSASAFHLSKKYTLSHIASNIVRLLLAIPVIIIRARQMSKPWNWIGYKDYLDTPISDIRQEYNIKVIK